MSFRIDRSGFLPLGELSSHAVRRERPGEAAPPSFDQVRISARCSGAEARVRELTGQLSRAVRTRPAARELSLLERQVAGGTYQPDAAEMARRMLLIQEA